MSGALVAFGIGKALQVGGDAANNQANWVRYKQQRDWDKQWTIDQMNIQRQWALEDWTRQNQYDSFLEQKKRLQAAGLNTNLLYGGHVSAASNDIRPVNVSAANRPAFKNERSPIGDAAGQLGSLAVNYQQIKNMEVQQDLMLAQTNKTNADTVNTMANTDLTKSQTDQLNRSKDALIEGLTLQNDKTKTEVGKLVSETTRTEAETERTKAETARTKVITEIEQDRNNREIAKNNADIAKIAQEIINLKLDEKNKEFQNSQNQQQADKLKIEIEQLKTLQAIARDEQKMKQVETIMFQKYGLTRSDPAFIKQMLWSMAHSAGEIK